MRIAAEQVGEQLARGLAPAWLVVGEDPLLAGEACDAIRAAARAAGVEEREVHFIERGVSWPGIAQSTQAMSLFASRKLVEIRMPGGKPGHGAAVLAGLARAAGDDVILLVVVEKLDRDARASEWVRAIEQRGVLVTADTPPPAAFPRWIARRAARLGLTLDEEGAALLANLTEGNLLAADQEIRKLLLAGRDQADAAAVMEAATSSSRHDVNRLTELALAGDAAGALRVLAGLRSEGTEPPLVLWAILREMRYSWMELHAGPRMPQFWTTSPAQSQEAARRLKRGNVRAAFARLAERASRADRMIKGRLAGNPWDELALLATELAGLRVLPLPRPAA